MATGQKTPMKKKTTAGKKATRAVKPAGKAGVRKKVQARGKTPGEKTKKILSPAGKTVRKKVGGASLKAKPRVKKSEPRKTALPAAKTGRRTSQKSARGSSSVAAHETMRQETLRKQLIQRREEIVREAKTEISKYITGEANQLVETALDDGDWSVIDVSADINLRRLETHRQRLLGIDAALMKLREGTYGVCEECGGEISAERLKVMPFAIFCVDCQEKKEQLEKIEREEIAP
jgi:DnaK suppressor protein